MATGGYTASTDLGLDVLQVRLDGLRLRDEQGVLLLVGGDRLFQVGDQRRRLVAARLVDVGARLQRLELVAQWLDALQHVGVVDLSDGPLDERSAGDRGAVDLVEVVVGVGQVLVDHLLAHLSEIALKWMLQQDGENGELAANLIGDVFGGEVDDGGDKVLADDDGAQRLPVRGGLTEEEADGLERQFHRRRRVVERAQLHQVLLLDALDGLLGFDHGRFHLSVQIQSVLLPGVWNTAAPSSW